MQAKQKLTRILSQAESVTKLLESSEQTLNYWREQYEKYQEKKQLQTKRRFLERELAWAEAQRREIAVKELEATRQKIQETLNRIEKDTANNTEQLVKHSSEQNERKVLKKKRLYEPLWSMPLPTKSPLHSQSSCKNAIKQPF